MSESKKNKKEDEANNNDGDDLLECEQDKALDPNLRSRSPSAMSQSSAVLEWDPSADVGTSINLPNTCDGISMQGTSRDMARGDHVGAGVGRLGDDLVKGLYVGPVVHSAEVSPELQVLYRPRKTARSDCSQPNMLYCYSTPITSRVSFSSLDCSPIDAQSPPVFQSTTSVGGTSGILKKESVSKKTSNSNDNSNKEGESSESNVNDALTEEDESSSRTAQGKFVSDASTDWEYDNEKKAASTSTSSYRADWRTHGITRSEIEYEKRKQSGSSSSQASSVFMLQVEAHAKSECGASSSANNHPPPPPQKKKVEKLSQTPGNFGTSTSSSGPNTLESTSSSVAAAVDLDRRLQFIRSRCPRRRGQQLEHERTDSSSEPSSLDPETLLKILEANPNMASVKYDVLKIHRDYHLAQVWKQISKLADLNRALLTTQKKKHGPGREEDTSSSSQQHHASNRREESSSHQHHASNRRVESSSHQHHVSTRGGEPSSHQRHISTRGAESSSRDHPISTHRKKNQKEQIKSQQQERDTRMTSSSRPQGYTSDPCDYVRDRVSNYEIVREKRTREVVNPKKVEQLMSKLRDMLPPSSTMKAVPKPKPLPKKKPSVGFFIPLGEFGGKGNGGTGSLPRKKTIEDYLREFNPQCYQNIKRRDEILSAVKRDREAHNVQMERFIVQAYQNAGPQEKRNLRDFWEYYMNAEKDKEDKENENVEAPDSPHVISTKEMKQRTARLRLNDPISLARRKKEYEERRKMATRVRQQQFSTNLREFQKVVGGVNVPDRLKLGPRPR